MPNIEMDLAMTETAPQGDVEVCLNMIVGSLREPYLAAALESAAKLCDWAVINLNGNEEEGGFQRNMEDVLNSRFNLENRLTIIGLPFRNFAFNWNMCLEASRRAKWIMISAADEVWYDHIGGYTVAEILKMADDMEANRITGTFWHFLKGHEFVHNASPTDALYTMQHFFLRMRPDLWWHDTVHEQTSGYRDCDLVLTEDPVFCHFSYIDPVRVFKKWVQNEAIQGRPDFYANYFKDPKAPWRKGPINILDDREGNSLAEFDGKLPEVMKDWTLDDEFHLHRADCPKMATDTGECCNHDPMVCVPKETIKDKVEQVIEATA